MDLAQLMPWIAAANTLMIFGVGLYALLTSGAKKTAVALDNYREEVDAAIIAHEKRIQSIESELKHLPDRTMVHELQLTLKDIQIEMASIKAQTAQSTRISQRVEEYLMTGGKTAA